MEKHKINLDNIVDLIEKMQAGLVFTVKCIKFVVE